jgi:hypothetical protein
MAHFQIPLDIPHAGTVAWRIHTILTQMDESPGPEKDRLIETVVELRELLEPWRSEGENPHDEASRQEVVKQAAELGRTIALGIERLGLGMDRLGQCVRNLFECLELGEEGAAISLRAGENPRSAARPV